MSDQALISICIPAYKGIEFLQRLLDSISIQLFRNFEVVVSDDSPDETVKELCAQYKNRFTIHHYRNQSPLGTPANWNEAIGRANGEWIKLMHDDDWFTDENSLSNFAGAINDNPKASFIFSAYRNHFLETGQTKDVIARPSRLRMLRENPVVLFASNVIGPPSVVLHKKSTSVVYDPKVKWVVDIDFYIRYLQNNSTPVYIDKILVNVGLGQQQVTQDCFRQRPIEIPENFYLLKKVGLTKLKNIFVYDAWWRLMRNLEIKYDKEITASGYAGNVPSIISSMINWQRQIPETILKIGAFSKMLMLLHFVFNKRKISTDSL